MKLLFAFFAESAKMEGNGIFSVLQGGLGCLVTPDFPASVPQLVLLMRIAFRPEECGKEYDCTVKAFDPSGTQVSELTIVAKALPNLRHPELDNTFTLFYRFEGFTIRMAGFYKFSLFVDGQLTGEMVVESIQEPRP